jgi:hypothetical protein
VPPWAIVAVLPPPAAFQEKSTAVKEAELGAEVPVAD